MGPFPKERASLYPISFWDVVGHFKGIAMEMTGIASLASGGFEI